MASSQWIRLTFCIAKASSRFIAAAKRATARKLAVSPTATTPALVDTIHQPEDASAMSSTRRRFGSSSSSEMHRGGVERARRQGRRRKVDVALLGELAEHEREVDVVVRPRDRHRYPRRVPKLARRARRGVRAAPSLGIASAVDDVPAGDNTALLSTAASGAYSGSS